MLKKHTPGFFGILTLVGMLINVALMRYQVIDAPEMLVNGCILYLIGKSLS